MPMPLTARRRLRKRNRPDLTFVSSHNRSVHHEPFSPSPLLGQRPSHSTLSPMKAGDYSQAAFRHTLTEDYDALFYYACTQTMSGENIVFLLLVKRWKSAWKEALLQPARRVNMGHSSRPVGATDDGQLEIIKKLFNVALEIYLLFINPATTDKVGLNLESGLSDAVGEIFGDATSAVESPDHGRSNLVAPFDALPRETMADYHSTLMCLWMHAAGFPVGETNDHAFAENSHLDHSAQPASPLSLLSRSPAFATDSAATSTTRVNITIDDNHHHYHHDDGNDQDWSKEHRQPSHSNNPIFDMPTRIPSDFDINIPADFDEHVFDDVERSVYLTVFRDTYPKFLHYTEQLRMSRLQPADPVVDTARVASQKDRHYKRVLRRAKYAFLNYVLL